MEPATSRVIGVGAWSVNPASGEISRDGETVRLELRTMRLLVCLAQRAGTVISIDDLLTAVWPDVTVTPDSVYQAVASLRRVLGDDPKQPTYIATVPRLGYRMVATVNASRDEPAARTNAPAALGDRARWGWATAFCVALLVAGLFASQIAKRSSVTPLTQPSIAVLPFLDLTEKMSEEEFADGVTEELIDRLNKVAGLRVPSPTASFYFKNKHRSIPEIAKTLDVAYVLDGSTRKSGDRLRVAARLTRADTGVVIWSESYDRTWGDILTVQDDIASEVTKALMASIDRRR
ncbi:MAG TPA: winged helix-turn-helix domain-containing protein [Vicinamibacterales bacterium]|nr:winged helix-turn-helix domain-containing protein [Vicinamibacterales bacterium]